MSSASFFASALHDIFQREFRTEVVELKNEVQTVVSAIPGHIRTEMKEFPHQVNLAAQDAFKTGVHDFKEMHRQLDSQINSIEERVKNTMDSLPSMVRDEMHELQQHVKELPVHVRHAAEEASKVLVGEVTFMKQHIRDDLIAYEQNVKALFEQLPSEISHAMKAQVAHLTEGMQGLSDSMQSEFSLVKSHVAGVKDHVRQGVKSAGGSICGSVSRAEPSQTH